jgi:Domain of unknown function (DUF4395)
MSGEVNFVRLQGLREASAESCGYQFPALMLQPRIIGVLVLLGVLFQNWVYFLALAIVLWWNVILPRLNPFDALYYRVVAKRRGVPRLGPAPGPRRFAQGMAGTFMAAIAACLYAGSRGVAWGLEAFLLAALGALIFARFCLGSYIFHLVTRQAAFANRTLPWSKPD